MTEFCNSLLRGQDIEEEDVRVSSKYSSLENQKNDYNADRNSVAGVNGWADINNLS